MRKFIIALLILVILASASYALTGKVTVKEIYSGNLISAVDEAGEKQFFSSKNSFKLTKGKTYSVTYIDVDKKQFEVVDDLGDKQIFVSDKAEEATGEVTFGCLGIILDILSGLGKIGAACGSI